MARDYVRKRPVRSQRKAPSSLLLFLAAFLGGYLAATVFDFASLSAWLNENVLAGESKAKTSATPAAKKDEFPKPKLEFYTLLTKDTGPQTLTNRPGASSVSRETAQKTAEPIKNAPAIPENLTSSPIKNDSHSVTTNASAPEIKPHTDSLVTSENKKEYYSIQVASFNRRQDAEQMKAALVLRGFDVFITPVNQGQIVWYRVILGPYTSRAQAEKALQDIARTEHMKGMLRKVNS